MIGVDSADKGWLHPKGRTARLIRRFRLGKRRQREQPDVLKHGIRVVLEDGLPMIQVRRATDTDTDTLGYGAQAIGYESAPVVVPGNRLACCYGLTPCCGDCADSYTVRNSDGWCCGDFNTCTDCRAAKTMRELGLAGRPA
jgi:hypothetical protein